MLSFLCRCSGIAAEHAKNGALLVDEHLRVRGHDDVYAIGDTAGHPLRGRRLSLASYLAYRHAVVDVVRGAQPSADAPLALLGVRRRVGYRTPFLGSAIFAVAQTSLLLTVPRRLAESYAGMAAVRTIAAPRELAKFSYALIWHKRLDASLAHAWFRGRIRAVAATTTA
jgi:DNA-binding transcriptional LysR family regulator